MKKIVFFTHEFNLNEGGPCTKRIDSFASYLSNNNYDVTIITGSHNKKNELKNIDRKYKIIYAPIIPLGKKKTIYRFIEQFTFAFFSFFVGLFKLKKSDYMFITSPPPLISMFGYYLGRIKKSKIIYDIRDIWPDVAVEMGSFNEKSFFYKIFKFIANFMYKHSDMITTVSPGKVEKIKGYVDNPEKVKFLSNGLDDNFIKFDINKEVIKEHNLDKKFTVVYIGNVGLAQNLDALVNLANNYKENENIQFLIFGDGAYKENLISKINELNLKNIFVKGKINYSNVYTVLKYSKISFISLKNSNMLDSVPTKIYDALGAGCPILLLAKGDSAKIIDEVKFGVHTSDENELTEKFEYMLNNYSIYENKKEEAIKYVLNNYSRSMIAKKFKEIIEVEK